MRNRTVRDLLRKLNVEVAVMADSADRGQAVRELTDTARAVGDLALNVGERRDELCHALSAEGWSYRAIGEMTGLSTPRVQQLVERGRKFRRVNGG